MQSERRLYICRCKCDLPPSSAGVPVGWLEKVEDRLKVRKKVPWCTVTDGRTVNNKEIQQDGVTLKGIYENPTERDPRGPRGG